MTHTTEQLEAMVAAANARADQARDAALVEAAGTLEVQALDTDAQAKRFRGGSDPWADRTARSRALRNSAAAILALRDKPAPAVTVGGGLCGCCGERPIAYPSEGECIDCFSANEGGEL